MVVVGHRVGWAVAIYWGYLICVLLEALKHKDDWPYWLRGGLATELWLAIVDWLLWQWLHLIVLALKCWLRECWTIMLSVSLISECWWWRSLLVVDRWRWNLLVIVLRLLLLLLLILLVIVLWCCVRRLAAFFWIHGRSGFCEDEGVGEPGLSLNNKECKFKDMNELLYK